MALQFFVCNELLYEFLPLLLEVPVLNADKIVPVYDNRGNSRPPI